MDKMDKKTKQPFFKKYLQIHYNFVKPNDNYAGWVGQRGGKHNIINNKCWVTFFSANTNC